MCERTSHTSAYILSIVHLGDRDGRATKALSAPQHDVGGGRWGCFLSAGAAKNRLKNHAIFNLSGSDASCDPAWDRRGGRHRRSGDHEDGKSVWLVVLNPGPLVADSCAVSVSGPEPGGKNIDPITTNTANTTTSAMAIPIMTQPAPPRRRERFAIAIRGNNSLRELAVKACLFCQIVDRGLDLVVLYRIYDD